MENKERIFSFILYLKVTSPRNEDCETGIMGKDFGGSGLLSAS
jgi:hypothetical protein